MIFCRNLFYKRFKRFCCGDQREIRDRIRGSVTSDTRCVALVLAYDKIINEMRKVLLNASVASEKNITFSGSHILTYCPSVELGPRGVEHL